MARTTTTSTRRHLRRRGGNDMIITTPELLIDIILYHIAPRLPVRSVFRLMTVSKKFYFFLKTRKFAIMHLHHVTNDKLLVFSIERPLKFSSIDCETPYADDGLIPPSRTLPLLDFYIGYVHFLTSFHGQVCACVSRPLFDLILWNPATGDYKTLSRTIFNQDENLSITGYGLYYSSYDDDYKLVYLNPRSDVYIYSLRSESWRKVVESNSRDYRMWTTTSFYLNESYYFIKNYPFVMMRFDTKTEKLTEIKVPPTCFTPPVGYDCPSGWTRQMLLSHKGCLHLCITFSGNNERCFQYVWWRMNGDGDWSMVRTYQWKKCHGSKRLYLMRNGNWLMFNYKTKGSFLSIFDPEKKKNGNTHLYTVSNVEFAKERRYTETLVSPNLYMNK